MQQNKPRIIKHKAGEPGSIDCHCLSQDLITFGGVRASLGLSGRRDQAPHGHVQRLGAVQSAQPQTNGKAARFWRTLNEDLIAGVPLTRWTNSRTNWSSLSSMTTRPDRTTASMREHPNK
ncbi:hypothetical protein [Candidatus Spongiihabitans sp.]|uniref:hypothetical protein n=1 Tax=Candidatus Spongiihabitans sp. TaxID=3101308 RepID=UPI003C6F986B